MSGEARAVGPTAGVWRVTRGVAVGASATALALGGHLLGGGQVAPGPATALALASTGLAVLWSARRWTTGALLTVLLGLQLAAHVALAGADGARTPLAAGHAAHGSASVVMSGHHDGAAMLVTHLLAAVLTAMLLRRGEHWCWRLAELAAGAVRALRLLAWTAPRPRPGRPVATTTYGVLPARLPGRRHPHRGPPAAIAA